MTEHANERKGNHLSPELVFLGLPEVYVAKGAHVAHFFRGEEERVNVLASYVQT